MSNAISMLEDAITCDKVANCQTAAAHTVSQHASMHCLQTHWTTKADCHVLLPSLHACMQEALRSRGKVLVHCSQGVSRSTTLLIAFLMWRSNQAYDETFQQVKAMRGVANPNIGFICQVQL